MIYYLARGLWRSHGGREEARVLGTDQASPVSLICVGTRNGLRSPPGDIGSPLILDYLLEVIQIQSFNFH